MKSILIGNGVNIQFGGAAYSNNFILKRIIFNALANRYDTLFANKIKGEKVKSIFRGFINTANGIIKGDYDNLESLDDQKMIKAFKKRYTTNIQKYYEIMLEDWFFLIRLYFISNNDIEHQWKSVKQGFESLILDAIYNDGEILKIHHEMGKKVKRFFKSFDNIFTLNYDDNIEMLTNKEVFHLHGDYSILADSENPRTIEGNLRYQSGQTVVLDNFEHCFCNALLDYSGDLKYKRAMDIAKGEVEIKRWLTLSRNNKKEFMEQMVLLKEKDEFCFEFIDTYMRNPDLVFGTDYHFKKLLRLKGELHIIGLSPKNDEHIFSCIDESGIEKVFFYYFLKEEMDVQINKPHKIIHVECLWKRLGVKKKKYNCSYPMPDNSEIDKFIEISNALSLDRVSPKDILNEINSTPLFKIKRLCEMVNEELEKQKGLGSPKNGKELMLGFNEISRIGLREGVLPSALFMMYTMFKSNTNG